MSGSTRAIRQAVPGSHPPLPPNQTEWFSSASERNSGPSQRAVLTTRGCAPGCDLRSIARIQSSTEQHINSAPGHHTLLQRHGHGHVTPHLRTSPSPHPRPQRLSCSTRHRPHFRSAWPSAPQAKNPGLRVQVSACCGPKSEARWNSPRGDKADDGCFRPVEQLMLDHCLRRAPVLCLLILPA